MTEAHTEVRRYEVSCLPWGHQARHSATFYVECVKANPDQWAVHDGIEPRRYLSKSGRWNYKSDFDTIEDFREACYFALSDAIALAHKWAPYRMVNGYTVEDLLKDFS